MVDLLERGESTEEFYEHSKLNLYQDQVFCFTPKGMLIALPRGATPIDFAYFVHTDVGNTAVGAKINGAHTPLHTPLKNGDQVEIITSRDQTPSPMWERFVATGRARAEIRRFLRHAQRDQHVSLGRKILEKVFADQGYELTEKAVEGVLRKLRLARPDDVYADVGHGALRADEVLEAVYPELKRDGKRGRREASGDTRLRGRPLSIAGLTDGIGYRLGACCHPIPGDRIIGLMVPGEGVVIHTVDCDVLDRHQDSMADWIDVRWKDGGPDYALSVARIMVRVKNTPGALGALANIIGQNGGNISNLKITSRNPLYFEIQIDVEVRDAPHLENIIRALKVDAAVEAVERVLGLDTDNRSAESAHHEAQGLLI
jgi:GTP pyrophosphokinase